MITAECEQIIDQLVKKHGYAKVRRELSTMIGEVKWNDWQSVCSYLERVGRQSKRRNQAADPHTSKQKMRPLRR